MRSHGVLAEVAGSPAKAKLLDLFVGSPELRVTGRQAALTVGISQPAALRALQSLVSSSVLSRTQVGPSYVYQLQGGHFLASRLKPVAGLDDAAFRTLKEIVSRHARKAGVLSAVLFGSRARGDERSDSDIDVFLTVPNERARTAASEAMVDATKEAMDLFGDPIRAIIHTPNELKSGIAGELAKHVKTEGIVLFRTHRNERYSGRRQ